MKRICLPLLLGAILVGGCAEPYTMKLNNGLQVTVPRKPTLANGAYHYKDSNGVERSVPAGRVREIEPASMARDEQQSFTPVVHKKRHWYLLWLG